MNNLVEEDARAQAALYSLESASVPDVTDTSYQAQLVDISEYAQTAFNEMLAQYRFLGLLAGIPGPGENQDHVDAARAAVMEAIGEFLAAGPLAMQVSEGWANVEQSRDALQERIYEEARSGDDAAAWMTDVQRLMDDIVPASHALDSRPESSHEWVASGGLRANIQDRLARVPADARGMLEDLLSQQETLSGAVDALRAERRAAIANFFSRMWNGIRGYYEDKMALIQNGQWLLAAGQITVDVALFAAEEIVIAGIVTAIIGLTGGLAIGMALALRGAVRAALSTVSRGARVVRNVRANYVVTIELRRVEPGILSSNPIPLNFSIGRKLDYEKTIDVEHDLTPDERRAMGEGGQGSTEPDADAPEAGDGDGGGDVDRPREDERPDGSYRNPNDPDGVRRTADGEAMIQNRNGTWRPVSQMADPDLDGDTGRPHNPQVGRWGEVEADRYAASQGWERLNGRDTTMQSPFTGPQRIDAIYRDPGPPPRIIVADAKALGSGLSTSRTTGIRQMSTLWIEQRLERAGLSDDMMDMIEADGYVPAVLRVDRNGNVVTEWLNANGNVVSEPWRSQ